MMFFVIDFIYFCVIVWLYINIVFLLLIVLLIKFYLQGVCIVNGSGSIICQMGYIVLGYFVDLFVVRLLFDVFQCIVKGMVFFVVVVEYGCILEVVWQIKEVSCWGIVVVKFIEYLLVNLCGFLLELIVLLQEIVGIIKIGQQQGQVALFWQCVKVCGQNQCEKGRGQVVIMVVF